MHYTICLKLISSSAQVALPPAFARLEQRGAPAPTVLLSSSSYFMHPHSSCIHAHMQTYKADFYNALYVPPGSKMLLTFAEILVTLRGCSVWSLTIVSVFCCFSMPCCPVGKPATRLSRASKQMKVIIIWAAFHTYLSHSNVGSKSSLEVWCGSNRLVLHPSPDKTFSQILTQKICQGPSMDSTLGTASRHHDKILQCCYFDAKCCQRSLKKVREGVNIKKTSLNHQNYIQCSQFLQCHA